MFLFLLCSAYLVGVTKTSNRSPSFYPVNGRRNLAGTSHKLFMEKYDVCDRSRKRENERGRREGVVIVIINKGICTPM